MKLEKGGEISVSVPRTEADCVRVTMRGKRDCIDRVITRREALVLAVELINLVDPCFLSQGERNGRGELHDQLMPDTTGLTDQGKEFVNEFYREQPPGTLGTESIDMQTLDLSFPGLPIALSEYEDDASDANDLADVELIESSPLVSALADLDGETA